MNAMRGTRYLSAWRQTVSDCGCTPATASKIATAPSSTRNESSTSTVKSTWPGEIGRADVCSSDLSAWRQTVSDCGCTPATASKIATAPSSTRNESSTSTVKSTWPGVSMMLMRYFLAKRVQDAVVAADVIVMPRSRSCSIQSMTVVPSCTSPIL